MTDDRDIEVGERYVPDELPENEMDPNGKLEWVSDDRLALITDGIIYEFKMAVECTAVCTVTPSGDVETVDGDPI